MKVSKAIRLLIKSSILKCKYHKKPRVMSSEETLDYILKNKCCISRFGDGELSLIEKRDLKFQRYDEMLVNKMKEVKTNEKCLVCIPNIFNKKSLNKKDIVQEEYKFWKYERMLFDGMWNKEFGNVEPLGDAFITRFYIRYTDKQFVKNYVNKLKKLWQDRNVILVEGETSQIGVGNDLLNNAKSIRRIICPSVNAFDFYYIIKQNIIKNYNEGDLVMLALGPTATVMAYELSSCNIWALDMGHFDIEYEWFLAKTDKKIPVKNKHVNECNSLGTINMSENYKSQIIYNFNTIKLEN